MMRNFLEICAGLCVVQNFVLVGQNIEKVSHYFKKVFFLHIGRNGLPYQMLRYDLLFLCDLWQVNSMQWNLLVACVVSLHFYNIVFIYPSWSQRKRTLCICSQRLVGILAAQPHQGVSTGRPAVSSCCSGTALIAVSALVWKTTYTPQICTESTLDCPLSDSS